MKVDVPKRKSSGPLDRFHWPEKKKLEVLQTFLVTGNLTLAAATCGVPYVTAKVWKTTQWWKDTEEELRRGSKIQLGARLGKLVQKSMDVLADRLDNGNYVFHPKTAQLVRQPISAEHANKITTQLIDRAISVERSAQVEKITDEGLDARLAKIRQEMLSFVSKRQIPAPVGAIIDVVPVPEVQVETPAPQAPEEVQAATPPVTYMISQGAKALGLDPIASDGSRLTLGVPNND